MNLRRFAPFIAAAISLLGCAPTLSTARAAVNAVSAVYDQTKVPLEQRYEQDQLACLEQHQPPPEPCVASVRKTWQHVKDAELAFYRSLLLAQSVVGTAEAGETVGKRPNVEQVMVLVTSAVEAGEKLRDAIQELHRLAGAAPAPAPARRTPGPWVPWTGPPVPAEKPGGAP
jgi:hypothetical protein